MRTNGRIRVQTRLGGGVDANTGDPIPVTSSWGDWLPCMIIWNTKGNLQRYDGGTYVPASYELHLEILDTLVLETETGYYVQTEDGAVACIKDFNPIRLQLEDDNLRSLGEHTVLKENLRYLEVVQRIALLI